MADSILEHRAPMWLVRTLLVLLFVIWSNAFTAIKHCREVLSPMQLVLARFLPVLLMGSVWILSVPRLRREAAATMREAPIKVAGMGLFGVTGYNFFIYLGQSEIKPGAAALVTTLAPLFTLLFAVLFLREKVPWKRTAGIIIAFIGLFIVLRWGRVGMGRITGIANADVKFMLIASLAPLSWSLYTIIGKDLIGNRSPVVVTCLPILIGTLPLLPFIDSAFLDAIASMRLSHWAAVAYLSLMSTVLGFFIWNFSLKRMPAVTVASFIYLNPPFAAFFGWLLYGEEVTAYFLAGSAVVLAGLWMAQNRRREV